MTAHTDNPEVQGIARFTIRQDKLDEFKSLSAQCMDIVRRKDRRTLQYEMFFNGDESECIVIERYADSNALLEHFANIGTLMDSITSIASVSGELLGRPSSQLREMIAGSGVRIFASRHTI